MKKSLHDKFKENANFVKPLYRQVKFGNRVRPLKKLFVTVDITGDTKPCGDGLHVKRKVVTSDDVDYNVIKLNSENYKNKPSPGANDKHRNYNSRFHFNKNDRFDFNVRKNAPFAPTDYMKMEVENGAITSSKSIQARNSSVLIEKGPETWLRVYPAPQISQESTGSVIFRCLVCQLGIAAFIVLWTILWVFIIHICEGPYETDVSIRFGKAQNQLVIDLATELRQDTTSKKIFYNRILQEFGGMITPLSPNWKHAIELRIEEERRLTMQAMAHGAKLRPGQFWDLSGTFLFTVYVMTALGFGAPVPQTALGKTSALIYAVLAVPLHIYLMVNTSTCVLAKTESCIKKRRRLRDKKLAENQAQAAIDNGESPNCSRNSELKVEKSKAFILRRQIERFLSFFYFGRCVPFAIVMYYACGAIVFGTMRGRQPLEVIMFPLEFTTTGGLEHVEGYIRILYGFYVEGAMTLLACALAALRAHSFATANYMSEKYRLFTTNKQQ